MCFDGTTAVASIATRGAIVATKTRQAGGQTAVTRSLLAGQKALGARADRTINPVVQKRVDKFVALSRGIDRAGARLKRRALGRPEPPPQLRRQKKATVGTGAALDAFEPDMDDTVDERLLSPQQRRALMLARRGYHATATGVFRGFANRVIDLSRRVVSLGVPSSASPGDDLAQRKLIADAHHADEDPETCTESTAPGAASDNDEEGQFKDCTFGTNATAAAASGHGAAYDQLARQLARAVNTKS